MTTAVCPDCHLPYDRRPYMRRCDACRTRAARRARVRAVRKREEKRVEEATMSEAHRYMPKHYTIDNSKPCLRCEEPGVIVFAGKVRKLCPVCFLKAMASLLSEFDPEELEQDDERR